MKTQARSTRRQGAVAVRRLAAGVSRCCGVRLGVRVGRRAAGRTRRPRATADRRHLARLRRDEREHSVGAVHVRRSGERPAVRRGRRTRSDLSRSRRATARRTCRWHRSQITVRPRNGFRPNTAYRDHAAPRPRRSARQRSQGRRRRSSSRPGATFPPFSIVGTRVRLGAAAPGRTARTSKRSRSADTTLVYVTATDTAGQLRRRTARRGHLPRARADRPERQSHASTAARSGTRSRSHVDDCRVRRIELDAIERDSTPPNIENVTPIDSVTLRVTFDKPLDPATAAATGAVPSAARRFVAARGRRASNGRRIDVRRRRDKPSADSTRAAPTPTTHAPSRHRRGEHDAAPPAAIAGADVAGAHAAPPPPPKPKSPPPDRGDRHHAVADDAARRPARVLVSRHAALRNLVGHATDVSRRFTTPKPPPPPDTTAQSRRPTRRAACRRRATAAVGRHR